jgi:hypothetical protein
MEREHARAYPKRQGSESVMVTLRASARSSGGPEALNAWQNCTIIQRNCDVVPRVAFAHFGPPVDLTCGGDLVEEAFTRSKHSTETLHAPD